MANKKTATKKPTELKLSGVTVDLSGASNARGVYRAALHPIRSKLLTLIDAAKGGQSDVTNLYKKEKMEQSVCSQHLAILRRAGLVITKRDGKQIFYSVNYAALKELNKASDLIGKLLS